MAGLGRSRGGLTGKVHLSADRRRRPLSYVLTPGQAGDSPQFRAVLARIKIRPPAYPPGRGGRRQGVLLPRQPHHLRRRRIKAVIPEKTDQAANRKKRGSAAAGDHRHRPP